MEQTKTDLINYKISRAEETAQEAFLAFDNNRYHLAENRIYYAMFYLVSALAVIHEISTAKHSSLKGWFNKEFIANGKIDKQFYQIYNRAFEKRQSGDYDDFIEYEKDEVLTDLKQMDYFIYQIKQYLEIEITL